MPTKTRTYFTVEGSGLFPFDMLRYDQCFPASEFPDSPALAVGYAFGDPDAVLKRRRVTLKSDWIHAPTVGRWKSMGWTVLPGTIARERLEFDNAPVKGPFVRLEG